MIKRKRRNPNDKILDSAYKQGTIEYQHLNNVAVDRRYEVSFMDSERDSYGYYLDVKLSKYIDSVWTNTAWSKVFKNKQRIAKDNLSQIFCEIRNSVEDKTYGDAEIFCAIAEFLSVPYETLYNMIPTKYKEPILKDLEEKYPSHFDDSDALF